MTPAELYKIGESCALVSETPDMRQAIRRGIRWAVNEIEARERIVRAAGFLVDRVFEGYAPSISKNAELVQAVLAYRARQP